MQGPAHSVPCHVLQPRSAIYGTSPATACMAASLSLNHASQGLLLALLMTSSFSSASCSSCLLQGSSQAALALSRCEFAFGMLWHELEAASPQTEAQHRARASLSGTAAGSMYGGTSHSPHEAASGKQARHSHGGLAQGGPVAGATGSIGDMVAAATAAAAGPPVLGMAGGIMAVWVPGTAFQDGCNQPGTSVAAGLPQMRTHAQPEENGRAQHAQHDCPAQAQRAAIALLKAKLQAELDECWQQVAALPAGPRRSGGGAAVPAHMQAEVLS